MPSVEEFVSSQASGKEVFAIIDGAACDGLLQLLEGNADEYRCLYRGELDDELKKAAPYLVRLAMPSPFAKSIIDRTWGKSCTIYPVMAKGTEIDGAMHHFRKLAKVRGPKGETWLFRYYDPRVLRVFVPTCDKEQTHEFFGAIVERFVCEDADPMVAAVFEFDQARLLPAKVDVAITPAGKAPS